MPNIWNREDHNGAPGNMHNAIPINPSDPIVAYENVLDSDFIVAKLQIITGKD